MVAFGLGPVVGALNPKTIAVMGAVLPQFSDPSQGHITLQLIVLGSLFPLIALALDSLWAVAAGTVAQGDVALPRTTREVPRRQTPAPTAAEALLVGRRPPTNRAPTSAKAPRTVPREPIVAAPRLRSSRPKSAKVVWPMFCAARKSPATSKRPAPVQTGGQPRTGQRRGAGLPRRLTANVVAEPAIGGTPYRSDRAREDKHLGPLMSRPYGREPEPLRGAGGSSLHPRLRAKPRPSPPALPQWVALLPFRVTGAISTPLPCATLRTTS